MPDSTVFAVASAKGGVGKTTTSINLGTALAARGLDVAVVELDLAMANVVDFLSLDFDDGADPSMHDVLAGERPVTDALYEAPGGATVVPSGTALDALGAIDMNYLAEAIEALDGRFDAVVLDTGAGVNSATTTAVSLADETILVSTPRVASVRDTEKTRTIVEQRGGDVGGLVLTQAGTGSSPGSDHLAEFLGVPLLCTVPQDATIHESQDAGVPVVERRPESEAARAYVEAASTLAESRVETPEPPDTTSGEGADAASGHEQVPADARSADGPADKGDDAETASEADVDPPSRETLEAEGWTFPGDGEAESSRDGDDAAVSVTDPARRTQSLRPVTSPGGDVSRTGEGNTPESAESEEPSSTGSGSTSERRPGGDRDDEEQTRETEAEGDETSSSLAGRVTALLRRS